jgi:hypothetical protein
MKTKGSVVAAKTNDRAGNQETLLTAYFKNRKGASFTESLLLFRARLRHPVHPDRRNGAAYWRDSTGTHTLFLHHYASHPQLVRLSYDRYVGVPGRKNCFRPTGPSSELTCTRGELVGVTKWLAGRLNANAPVPGYAWTAAAWNLNPHKGDPKDTSPPPLF